LTDMTGRKVVIPRVATVTTKRDSEGNETDTCPYEDKVEEPFVGSTRSEEGNHSPADDRHQHTQDIYTFTFTIANVKGRGTCLQVADV